MATIAQINANRQNAAHSTGPVTESGKAASSRNALSLGLYTRQDYVKPDERDLYKEFCQTMYSELTPVTLLEESLTAEITGATWRLRRCSNVEGELADYSPIDPFLDETTEKTRRTIERARASAHCILHRSINQLRKLQTERTIRFELSAVKTPPPGKPEPEPKPLGLSYDQIMAMCEPDPGVMREIEAEWAATNYGLNGQPPISPGQSASNCKPAAPAPTSPETPRNSPCPCGSGKKFKVCCLRQGPGWLVPAAA